MHRLGSYMGILEEECMGSGTGYAYVFNEIVLWLDVWYGAMCCVCHELVKVTSYMMYTSQVIDAQSRHLSLTTFHVKINSYCIRICKDLEYPLTVGFPSKFCINNIYLPKINVKKL